MKLATKIFLFFLLGTYRVSPAWYFKVKLRFFFSKKIKVGFGPIISGEDDLAVRKWRIDPIINAINQKSQTYCAGFFIHPHEMKKFDVIVLVKRFHPKWLIFIAHQHLIYDIVDNPNDEPQYRHHFLAFPEFMNRIDRVILSSPVHALQVKKWDKKALLIEHPILNPTYKTSYESREEIKILAQGFSQNLLNLQWLEPWLPLLSKEAGKPVRLYYHSEGSGKASEFVRYIRWSVKNCFEVMNLADIAITMKDLHTLHQHTKPSTKIIAYMAAGLPVICKPSAADRLVITHQVNGYFAYGEKDWLHFLRKLIKSSSLRRQIGKAARAHVHRHYTLDHVADKYLKLLDSLYEPSDLLFPPHPQNRGSSHFSKRGGISS